MLEFELLVFVERSEAFATTGLRFRTDCLRDDCLAFAPDAFAVVLGLLPYVQAHLDQGGRLHQITRHMLGVFTGRPGARGWRRLLSEGANRPGAGTDLLLEALAQVQTGVRSAA